MSKTVDAAAELGCTEMVTFVIEETDLTVAWEPSGDKKAITMQIEQTWDDKTTTNAAIWFDARVACRIAQALMEAASQVEQ